MQLAEKIFKRLISVGEIYANLVFATRRRVLSNAVCLIQDVERKT